MSHTISLTSVNYPMLFKKLVKDSSAKLNILEKKIPLEYISNNSLGEVRIISEDINSVANLVANFIVEYWEDILIRKIIKNDYYYFSAEEKEIIYDETKDILEQFENESGLNYKILRKEKIASKVEQYLAENSELIIEGFINFRLKEYLHELELAVEEAVDNYLLEKEYNEFIRLLKYLVEIQEPKVKVANIVLDEEGYFQLYDDENRLINNYLDGFIIEMVDEEINHEDLLISALITLAPEIVILHQAQKNNSKNIIKTIKRVFGDRVKDCNECSKCIQLNEFKK